MARHLTSESERDSRISFKHGSMVGVARDEDDLAAAASSDFGNRRDLVHAGAAGGLPWVSQPMLEAGKLQQKATCQTTAKMATT